MNTAWISAINVAQGFYLANPGSLIISPVTWDIARVFIPDVMDDPKRNICKVSADAYLPAGPLTRVSPLKERSRIDSLKRGLRQIGYTFKREMQPSAPAGFVAIRETASKVQLSVRFEGKKGSAPVPGQRAPFLFTLGASLMEPRYYEHHSSEGLGVLVAGLAEMLEPMISGKKLGFSLEHSPSVGPAHEHLVFVAAKGSRK